jgi:hypothetical protein
MNSIAIFGGCLERPYYLQCVLLAREYHFDIYKFRHLGEWINVIRSKRFVELSDVLV